MTFYDNASGEMLVEQISYSVFHHWLLGKQIRKQRSPMFLTDSEFEELCGSA